MIEIVWWESCITQHQIYTLSELSKIPNVKVTVFSLSLENTDRKKQGWGECDWSLIDMIVIPRAAYKFMSNSLKDKKDSIHIFGGPFDSWKITFALFFSMFLGNRTYILTEPHTIIPSGLLANGNRFRNWLVHKARPLKFGLLWILLRDQVEGVFAISETAIDQLLSFGVSREKILPYAYFVPPMQVSLNSADVEVIRDSSNEDLRLLFVGSLNHTKGVDLLVNAVNRLKKNGVNVTLDVFGPAESLKEYCWSPCVRYRGIIPFGEAQSIMTMYEFLVLPSRYDGWGVVVNEALLAGIPVICSDRVGASSLIKRWNCGVCYGSATDFGLEECILSVYQSKKLALSDFKEAINLVCEIITPKYGAQFIYDCVENKKSTGLDAKSSWYL